MKNIIISSLIFLNCIISNAQTGNILKFKKISATSGNFLGLPDGYSFFGDGGLMNIGDLNKDGTSDYAIAGNNDNTLQGIVFVLFMNSNQTVKSYSLIGNNIGGLNGSFSNMQDFGESISNIGDLDNDGINEIVVGNFSGGGNNRGEAFILFLNENGTVKKYVLIGSNNISLINSQYFGTSCSFIGDLDNDSKKEIAISSRNNNDGGSYNGIVYIISLNSDGTIYRQSKISSKSGSFSGLPLGNFGQETCGIGDLNKDGINDLIVTSFKQLWVLFLDTNAKVKSYQEISSGVGGYGDSIKSSDLWGFNLTSVGDIDNDQNQDIVISSSQDSVNNLLTGRIRILFLNQNGTVKSIKRIDNNAINFSGVLSDGDNFGSSLIGGFDFDGDFKNDLIVGAATTDDGGTDKGAIYLLSLEGAVHQTPAKALWRVNATSGNQNTVFNFTQYSTGFPSAFKWSITPNTFTYQSGTSDTSANPIIKFNQTANYSVQLKVTNPFSADSLLRSSYINVQKVGVNNLTNNNSTVSIFPNPTNGLVKIQSPINIQTILVFDITGKQLLQQEPNTQTDELNMSSLPPGLYQIHVQTEMGVLVKKLVKE